MSETDKNLVYVAGPLYTPGQRIYLERLADGFESGGYDVFLPHRDAGFPESDEDRSREIFELDVERIEAADVIVAVLNGFDVDAGTAFELGYAYAVGTPSVGIYDDSRISDDVERGDDTDINLMITNSTGSIVTSREELIAAVDRAL